MKNKPLVSVIALCYNHQAYVCEALNSILSQTYLNIQLIIMDDCSTDDSVAHIEKWRSTSSLPSQLVCHLSNHGICKTINEALFYVKGEFVAIVSTDDLWLHDKLEKQVELFELLGSDYGVVFGDAYRIDAQGEILPGMFIEHYRNFVKIPQGYVLEQLLEGNFIPAPSALIRSSCYEKVGLYDEELSYEDWDMWVRIARNYKFALTAEPLTKYRILPTSLSHSLFLRDNPKTCLSHFLMTKKWLAIPGLSFSQKAFLKNACTTHAMHLNRLKVPRRRHYLKEALKCDFQLKTAVHLIFACLPGCIEKNAYSVVKNLRKKFK